MTPPPDRAGLNNGSPRPESALPCEVCGAEGETFKTSRFDRYLCAEHQAEFIDLDLDLLEYEAAEQKSLNDLFEETQRTHKLVNGSRNGKRADQSSFHNGGIILDAPEHVPAIWGRGHDVLWSEGEPMIIAGPPGVGKTTIAQQLTLARCGIGSEDLLGYPVAPSTRKTLYIAADRPQQALRSMRRMVKPEQRERLEEMLVVRMGPFDALTDREKVVADLEERGIGTVVIDSIKDVAGDVTDGKIGAELNKTLQSMVARGIEVLALHHNRKGQQGNKAPKRLDDLYGSQWIAAGAGSVVCFWGEAGDESVDMLHLKQPDNVVGPLTLTHDHTTGTSTIKPAEVRAVEKREAVRLACIEVLDANEPMGINRLKKAIRRQGVSCESEKFNPLLDSIADEVGSGVYRTAKGFFLGCPE